MTPSELLADPEFYAYIETLAKRASSNVASRFRSSSEDLTQEALLWCLQHPAKFTEYWSDENQKRGEGRLVKAMRNACKDYATREQAAAGGSDHETSFWYRGELIEELLPHIWNEASWTNPPKAEVKSRGGDPSLGNTWLATLADVKAAVERQSLHDQHLLRTYYHTGLTQAQIAALGGDHPISQQKVGRDLKRALGRVREELGGRPPWRDEPEPGWQDQVGSRHAISNAAARAITSNSYEGDRLGGTFFDGS